MTTIRRTTRTTIASALLALLFPLAASAATTWYVAPTGSDTAAGTMAAPFATWGRAQTAAAAGDTVYFRAGRYLYTTATNTCGGSTTATVDAVVLSKSGTSGNMINYWAYPGETPVFDFSGITGSNYNCRHSSVRVEGSYLYLKGLEITGTLQLNTDNHESWGVYITGGNNNKFELINSHHNMGPGFFLQTGGNNTFLNCDSHENEDTMTSNGDGQSADGFGCHPNKAGNTGNIFHGCRAWWNSDDGWDFINATEACTVEYSWAWYGGYKPDAISGGNPVSLAAGNGNGFKGGGYGDPATNVPANPPIHVVQYNASFYNKANGVYANHGPVNVIFYNNTSYNNGVDFDMLGLIGTTDSSVGLLRNNLAFGKTLTSDFGNPGPIDDKFNSWDSSTGVTVSAADFQSVSFSPPASCPAAYSAGGTVCVLPTDTTSFAGMASARQADGSLPVLPFLHLAAGSDLIDKGTDVGLPFVGKAPDLGAFEYGATGGSPGTGGTTGTGGTPATGGTTGTGGTPATGGTTGAAGKGGTSGASGTGGAKGGTSGTGTGGASGGTSGTGGTTATGTGGSGTSGASGGSSGTGTGGSGVSETGGTSGTGTGGSSAGTGGNGAGGSSETGTGGSGTGGAAETDSSSGCSCQTGPAGGGNFAGFTLLSLLGLTALRSRKRAR
jgi:MYXO-CTERM domain-containing protein